VVVGSILVLKLHAFLALLLGALVVAAATSHEAIVRFGLSKKMTQATAENLANQSIGERVAREFGNTCGKIGIIIALASVIGKCLLDSGAADRIVRATLRLFGEKRAPLAFLSSGYLLGIPVFFDTVFLLMIPLGKAMALHTKRNFLLYVLTIIAGATMTHSLVPPTPGPLFVANELNVDLGVMILAGCVVSVFAAAGGWAYATWANRHIEIPLRDSGGVSLAELEAVANRKESELPPLLISLLPIALPVILIGGAALGEAVLPSGVPNHSLQNLLKWAGDANLALAAATVMALATLAWQKRQSLKQLGGAIADALSDGGQIILITAAGGAFGGVLQQSGIAERIESLAGAYNVAMLPLAFFLTALVRVAQGSATVAMITAAGVMAGFTSSGHLGFHPVYVALAIGCGSKLIPWMNDSGFWVVCKMSGMTENETLKTFTPMAFVMGVVGLLATMLLAWIVPLR
jgi:GntP family gluconate:H+ symporter